MIFSNKTAAHCLYGRQTTPSFYTIEIGVHDRNAPESWSVTRKGSKIVLNPIWSPDDFRNDISMMILDVIIEIYI